jgi:hypothetical protein
VQASLIADEAFTVSLPRERRDVAGMLADPQITHALRAAINAFVRAIAIGRSEEHPR